MLLISQYEKKIDVAFFSSLNNPIDEILSINFMRQNQRFLISAISIIFT